MAYELSEKVYNDYELMALRAYDLTGETISEEQAAQLIKLIKKTTTIAEQNTIIINYLA
jgi:hypothetical protein